MPLPSSATGQPALKLKYIPAIQPLPGLVTKIQPVEGYLPFSHSIGFSGGKFQPFTDWLSMIPALGSRCLP
jgi:hypothetical protein